MYVTNKDSSKAMSGPYSDSIPPASAVHLAINIFFFKLQGSVP